MQEHKKGRKHRDRCLSLARADSALAVAKNESPIDHMRRILKEQHAYDSDVMEPLLGKVFCASGGAPGPRVDNVDSKDKGGQPSCGAIQGAGKCWSACGRAVGGKTGSGGRILLFYKYNEIKSPDTMVLWQHELCRALGITGRVRIAPEGVNGTVGGTIAATDLYKAALSHHPDLRVSADAWKESPGCSDDFTRLEVRRCEEIVSIGIPGSKLPASRGGEHLSPEEFHSALIKSERPPVLIDCRNAYEWRVGRFKGAMLPPTRSFTDFPKFCDNLVAKLSAEQRDFKSTPVYMYCTGGIRCERGSAYLRSKGVETVYQLRGGVHRYLEAYPGSGGLFKGKLFVFDKRRLIAVPGAETVGKCALCGCSFDDYDDRIRCSTCRELALVCLACRPRAHLKHGDKLGERAAGARNFTYLCPKCEEN